MGIVALPSISFIGTVCQLVQLWNPLYASTGGRGLSSTHVVLLSTFYYSGLAPFWRKKPQQGEEGTIASRGKRPQRAP